MHAAFGGLHGVMNGEEQPLDSYRARLLVSCVTLDKLLNPSEPALSVK